MERTIRIRNHKGNSKKSSLPRTIFHFVNVSDLRETGQRETNERGEETSILKHTVTSILYNLKKLKTEVDSRLEDYKDLYHPNLIYLYSSVSDNDCTSLLLENASEGNLYLEILLNGCLPTYRARKVFKDVCEALKYMHDRGVVHRAVRSNFIHFNKSGQTKIDFWLYDLEIDESDAPELGNGKEPTKESDVWALGVLLYEMLHGFIPSQDFTLNNDLFPLAADLIRRILVQDPRKRITVREILNHPFVAGDKVNRKKVIHRLEKYLNSKTNRSRNSQNSATINRSTCESREGY